MDRPIKFRLIFTVNSLARFKQSNKILLNQPKSEFNFEILIKDLFNFYYTIYIHSYPGLADYLHAITMTVTATSIKAKAAAKASKKTKKPKEKAPLSPEEEVRRGHQRQIQQLVLKLRKQNLPADEIKRRSWNLKNQLWWSSQSDQSGESGSYWKSQKLENEKTKKRLGSELGSKAQETAAALTNISNNDAKTVSSTVTTSTSVTEKEKESEGSSTTNTITESAPLTFAQEEADEARLEKEIASNLAARIHDIVIIPIVWRGRHDRTQLLNAAEGVKTMLLQTASSKNNLDVWIDSRRHHTPGQKFAFWEHKGVKFRIEVGPKDLERRQLCLCRHPETAGDYQNTVKKWVSMDDNREILVELTKLGVEKLAGIIKLDRFEGKEAGILERFKAIDEEGPGPTESDGKTDKEEKESKAKKLDYSSMYSKEELGGTVADYTKRFNNKDTAVTESTNTKSFFGITKQQKREMKYGGGGVIKPRGVDGDITDVKIGKSRAVPENGPKDVTKLSTEDTKTATAATACEDNFDVSGGKVAKIKTGNTKRAKPY